MSRSDAETILADLREEYEQRELDQDRTATEEGFVEWLAVRLHANHDALTRITDADDDVFTTLEGTVEYVVTSYRNIAKSEAEAADEIARLRERLDAAEQVCVIFGWTAAAGDDDRDKAVAQAWHDWAGRYGAPGPTPEWNRRVADLARRRGEIRQATLRILRGEPHA